MFKDFLNPLLRGFAGTPERPAAPSTFIPPSPSGKQKSFTLQPFVEPGQEFASLFFTGRGRVFCGSQESIAASATVLTEVISPLIPFWGFVRTWSYSFSQAHLTLNANPVASQLPGRSTLTVATRRPNLFLADMAAKFDQNEKGFFSLQTGLLHVVPLDFLLPGAGWGVGVEVFNGSASTATLIWWFEVLEVVPGGR